MCCYRASASIGKGGLGIACRQETGRASNDMHVRASSVLAVRTHDMDCDKDWDHLFMIRKP